MTLTEITSPVERRGREALESRKASLPELDHSASMPSMATMPSIAASPCMASSLSAMMPGESEKKHVLQDPTSDGIKCRFVDE